MPLQARNTVDGLQLYACMRVTKLTIAIHPLPNEEWKFFGNSTVFTLVLMHHKPDKIVIQSYALKRPFRLVGYFMEQ